ncbi:MAG TPA: Uma2 family endonuclease [Blastocatellia bacterium]|nr:Uma2 family endonuclease [Blastocatellia bacterium]
MTARIEPLVTVADLDLMPDDGNRYEIIDGEMLVSRTPGLTHQTISANLLVSLKNYLLQNPVGDAWATPGVIFDELNAVIPDLVFVSKARRAEVAPGERIVGAPDILIEILSPESENERRDRVIKRQVYARFGVKEYWIIDPVNRAVEV